MLRTEKVRSQCRLRTETKPGKDGGPGGPPQEAPPAHKAPLPHDLDAGRRVDLDDRFALFVEIVYRRFAGELVLVIKAEIPT